jgi:hypothetical protein
VIEGGSGWMNIAVFAPDQDANAYILGPVRAIVDEGKLLMYTSNADEAAFIAANKVRTVYEPLLEPGREGYNSGNELIGLCLDCLSVLLFITHIYTCFSCQYTVDWSNAAVDAFV